MLVLVETTNENLLVLRRDNIPILQHICEENVARIDHSKYKLKVIFTIDTDLEKKNF